MRSGTPSGFSDGELSPIFAVDFAFDSGNVRFWSGLGEITIDSNTYYGAGSVIQISAIEESSEISAKGITITASGLDSSVISWALNETYQNRTVTVHVGTISESLVPDTYILFRGRMDTMDLTENGDTSTVEISAENRLIDLERPRVRRYTNEDQKSLYPNDIALEMVDDLQDMTIDWGKSK